MLYLYTKRGPGGLGRRVRNEEGPNVLYLVVVALLALNVVDYLINNI